MVRYVVHSVGPKVDQHHFCLLRSTKSRRGGGRGRESRGIRRKEHHLLLPRVDLEEKVLERW